MSEGTNETSGIFIKILEELSTQMGFTYTLVPTQQYNPKRADLASWPFDMCMIDLHDPKNYAPDLAAHFEYSHPFYNSQWSGLVLKTRVSPSLFRVFDPFESYLWFALIGFILLAAVAVMLINIVAPSPEFESIPMLQRLTPEIAGKSVYHMFATLLNGEDYEWTTWPERVLRLSLLFLVMIVAATYTANLAAFLTKPGFKIHGPRDLTELAESRACFNIAGAVPSAYVKSFFKAGDWRVPYVERQAVCHQALRDSTADIWLADVRAVNYYLHKHCEDLAIVNDVQFSSVMYGWAVRAPLKEFAFKLSAGIAHFVEGPAYSALLGDAFATGRALPASCSMGGGDGTTPIGYDDMKGLFIIVGTGFAASTLLAVAKGVYRGRVGSPKKGDEVIKGHTATRHTMTEGEMLRCIMKKLDAMSAASAAERGGRHTELDVSKIEQVL